MPAKVVVFDLGKVLVDFDYGIAARGLASLSKLPPQELQPLLEASPLLVEFEHGHSTRDQFFRQVCEATGFGGDQANFNRLFSDIFSPIEAMIEFHSRLRKAGVPTYIFSNTNELAVEHIRSRFPFFSKFDGYILSYEHGAMKPSRGIYEIVERTTGTSGPDICYIDDRLENIETGKAMGWQSIWYKRAQDTIAEANKIRRRGGG